MNPSPPSASSRRSVGASTAAVFALLLPALGGAPAAGQEPAADTMSIQWATLTGQVVSAATGKPLDGALVSLRGSRYGAITDSTGHFRIPRAAPGQDTVAVSYVGYEENSLPLFLEPDKLTRVVFLLSPTVVRLADIVVEVEREPLGPLREFDRRRQRGLGHYITYEEIEKRSPRYASDMLRGVPGVRVGAAQLGRAEVTMSRSARPCEPNIVLDGIFMRGFHIDEVPAADLEALEIYSGPSEMPAQYAGIGAQGCGLIVIWTRRGGRQ